MRTVVLGERPQELEALIARRRALGQDRFDEVWEGEYHMAPAARGRHGFVDRALARLLDPLAERAGLVSLGQCNIGRPDDFRVPDNTYHASFSDDVWFPTAVVVVEVVSPDDETWQKLDFYAAHGIEELVIADPEARRVRIFTLADGRYDEVERNPRLGATAEELAAGIAWSGKL